jgi:hypothetical protein
MQCNRKGLARSRASSTNRTVRRNTVAVGSRKCPVPRRGQRAWVLDDWFHEIRSDEAGIFVTYRKGSQVKIRSAGLAGGWRQGSEYTAIAWV